MAKVLVNAKYYLSDDKEKSRIEEGDAPQCGMTKKE